MPGIDRAGSTSADVFGLRFEVEKNRGHWFFGPLCVLCHYSTGLGRDEILSEKVALAVLQTGSAKLLWWTWTYDSHSTQAASWGPAQVISLVNTIEFFGREVIELLIVLLICRVAICGQKRSA
jgi:hypothetical protein